MKKGKLIAIEGTDGSGKTEQFKLLVKKLKDNKIDFRTLDFPQYDRDSSYFIKRYLRGEYGSLNEVSSKKASLFYALDRFDVSERIKKWLKDGLIVVSNRYTGSNMAHQAAKALEMDPFLEWLDNIEHKVLGIPRPDINIVLRVPAEISQKLGDKKKKGRRNYVDGKRRDLHEENLNHLKKAEETYVELCNKYPNSFNLVECVKNKKLLSIEKIGEKVWSIVKKDLDIKT